MLSTTYQEVFQMLSYECALITFMKKNGDIRVMLGTRNIQASNLIYDFLGGALGGHDNRCSLANGNIAVIDLALGDVRSFSINRLIGIEYLGNPTTKEQLDEIFEQFNNMKGVIENNQPPEEEMEIF